MYTASVAIDLQATCERTIQNWHQCAPRELAFTRACTIYVMALPAQHEAHLSGLSARRLETKNDISTNMMMLATRRCM